MTDTTPVSLPVLLLSALAAFAVACLWLLALLATAYLWLLALASARPARSPRRGQRRSRFAVLLPAHNEAEVIGRTVAQLRRQDYPADRFAIYVVADRCQDATAATAADAGAVVYERNEGPSGSKGAALAWLMDRVLEGAPEVDALAIFDADTQVDPGFLAVVDAHLEAGAQVVQGRHLIWNPEDGPYPALADAMMRIDNRFGNQGRANLGLSAKHMGDSIVFRTDIVRRYWRDAGLTEDYALRQRLILAGIRIDYAPLAVGYGEAPASWTMARRQRERWLSGTFASSAASRRQLLGAAFGARSALALDGALQAYLPAYSTLLVLVSAGTAFALVALQGKPGWFAITWLALLASLVIYPFFGLLADGAPRSAYLALAVGPFFVLWRTILAVGARWPGRSVVWRRTPRRAA